MRRQYYLIGGWVVGLLLCACAGQIPSSTATAEPAPPTLTAAPPTPTNEPPPTPTQTPVATSAICSPLAGHEISTLLSLYLTQPFIPPAGANKETGHHGLDFAYYSGGPTGGHINGTPVQSVLDGYVAGVGYNAVYGNYLVSETPFEQLPAGVAELYSMRPDDSLYLLYAHLQQPVPFTPGDRLACAQVLGHVGDSGDRFFVSDPHLHFETRIGAAGLRLGAMAYYTTTATEEEKAEYMRWRTSDEFRLADPMMLLTVAP